jgi:hypothetical protein
MVNHERYRERQLAHREESFNFHHMAILFQPLLKEKCIVLQVGSYPEYTTPNYRMRLTARNICLMFPKIKLELGGPGIFRKRDVNNWWIRLEILWRQKGTIVMAAMRQALYRIVSMMWL